MKAVTVFRMSVFYLLLSSSFIGNFTADFASAFTSSTEEQQSAGTGPCKSFPFSVIRNSNGISKEGRWEKIS